ncbi:hypothetical protein MN113_29170 [Pseudomonas veronii]|uniref:hypothetical protein n=1 Tax=Pseudomonas veronii TaxID=76761 RepID=UPI0021BF935F|nr:hypothetical protein [Pseudomonas veronii]MCT8965237.1 hypothetical protein [Pseudomonas veronii]
MTALAAVATAEVSTSGHLAFAFLFAGLACPMYSLCVVQINDVLKSQHMVVTRSNLMLAFGIGAVTVPSVEAAVMNGGVAMASSGTQGAPSASLPCTV